MPTQPYYVDGERVPGTTTIISRFKRSDGLVHWAWDLGRRGLDYRDVRDHAADTGTLAHSIIEADIRNKPLDLSGAPEEQLLPARLAFTGYQEWKRSTRLVPTNTELSLVSRKYRYGGTLDAMLIQDKLSIGDWKTSNHIYTDYLIQLAAYKNLWEENFPDQPITGGLHLLRVSKLGDFSHHWWAELDAAWRQFLLYREAYENEKLLKGRI